MKKLIKLEDEFYIVEEAIINFDEFCFDVETKEICKSKGLVPINEFVLKVTHSTKQIEEFICNEGLKRIGWINIIPLDKSEIEGLICGFDIRDMAYEYYNNALYKNVSDGYHWSNGFKEHQKLVKDKIFTAEDMKEFGLWLGNNLKDLKNKNIDDIFNSSPFVQKTEWNIEIDDLNKIKLL